MAYHDVRFPEQIERGAVGGPVWSTAIATTTGGAEYRQANWSMARYKWDIASGLKDKEGYDALLAFFNARMGRLHSFRFRDWSDYEAPALSPVALVPGTASTYRLVKAYSSGDQTYLRPITKPVLGGVTLSSGMVDYLTGIVSDGAGVTWSGQFDVPARFESDEFQLTLQEIKVGQAQGVGIFEVRE